MKAFSLSQSVFSIQYTGTLMHDVFPTQSVKGNILNELLLVQHGCVFGSSYSLRLVDVITLRRALQLYELLIHVISVHVLSCKITVMNKYGRVSISLSSFW